MRKTVLISGLLSALLTLSSCKEEHKNAKSDRLHSPEHFEQNTLLDSPDSQDLGTTRQYTQLVENPFLSATQEPLSTFSIDVDTASMAQVRHLINSNKRPPKGLVRIEEMLNYFNYNYPSPKNGEAFSVNTEMASCPWNMNNKLVKIGLKGKTLHSEKRPSANLIFLVDVSGSMNSPNKLGLLKKSMTMMLETLGSRDRISIVTYAGNAAVVLDGIAGNNFRTINRQINALASGGGTNGAQGIHTAYDLAKKHFIKNGINRVVLATDGDFNVGLTGNALIDKVKAKARENIYLSILSFGANSNDQFMEKLSNDSNGNYAHIDSLNEARKVLIDQINGTLMTIAKDVKIQVKFNSEIVDSYRLIGYENRVLENEEFDDDSVDAGDIGAGHTVTALYEVLLKNNSDEGKLLTVRLRHKEPEGTESKLIMGDLKVSNTGYLNASTDFRFASAVAAYGMLLRNSKYSNNISIDSVISMAQNAIGSDLKLYRRDFINMEVILGSTGLYLAEL